MTTALLLASSSFGLPVSALILKTSPTNRFPASGAANWFSSMAGSITFVRITWYTFPLPSLSSNDEPIRPGGSWCPADAVLPEGNGVTETATVLWRLLMFPITTPRTMTTASVMIAPRNLGLRLGRGGRGP